MPEVTYSWGSEAKADLIFSVLKERGDWNISVEKVNPKSIALFTALSPISTFYYGEVPLRLKFKPGTVFIPYSIETSFSGEACRHVKKKKREASTPIFLVEKPLLNAETGAKLFEVVLCNFDSVESISRGEKAHFDETIRDLYRLHQLAEQAPRTDSAPRYSYIQYRGPQDPYPRSLIDINFMGRPFVLAPSTYGSSKPAEILENRSQIIDKVPVNEYILAKHLKAFHTAAESGRKSEILVNPDVTAPTDHFAWKRPLWFSSSSD